jgi:DNA topoisomerase-1
MASKLVIVESPAKARTLKGILGKNYVVVASVGHVRDLPKREIGIDLETFTPKYVVMAEKKKVIKEIKDAANAASSIYLATDPDREGEAISWHLVEAAKLNKDDVPIRRIVFHEVTKQAIEEAIKNPREIDMQLVNAQQARRLLDRLVGYKLSPLLWRKVQKGLSAGRVQSAALKIIVDREREIQKFVPEEYWTIETELKKGTKNPSFRALLVGYDDGPKFDVSDKATADEILANLSEAKYAVKDVDKREGVRQPAPPFITSTLQQEASRKLHYSATRTMAIAQQLYEGLPVGDEGQIGLITYMRTDSTHLAASAVADIRDLIKKKYGPEYVPSRPNVFAKKQKFSQEAHEAIRPTSAAREPASLAIHLRPEQLKLYELIWNRAVASQMAAAVYDNITIQVDAESPKVEKPYLLRANSSSLKFPGFITLYTEGKDEEEVEAATTLPELENGDKLKLLEVIPEKHFTKPPPRYTEATLIKTLEQKGIGRPSTYAPILGTIQEREYVRKDKLRIVPEELGFIVNDLLAENFPNIVDLGFTAKMEKELDNVAQGKEDWVKVLRQFYTPFEKNVEDAFKNVQRVDVTETTDEICPECGKPMVIKRGRFGKFIACTGYPECKKTLPILNKVGVACPECGKDLIQLRSKKKRIFYGCSGYPNCKFAVGGKPVNTPCPQCGKLMAVFGKNLVRCTACTYRTRLSQVEKPEADEQAAEAKV